MRYVLFCAALSALAAVAWSAQGTTAAKKTPAKSGQPAAYSGTTAHKAAPYRQPATNAMPAASRGTTAARTTATRTTRRAAPAPVAHSSSRARQMAPAPERYKEIQDALVAKGYLSSEEANGVWGGSSTEALKRFQNEQNLDSSGKINSISLIALGLGPKRDAAPMRAPATMVPAQDLSGQDR